MNFLLHRHLARRDLGDARAGVGAMLPDAWRMADRRVRARRGVAHEGPLFDGIRHHLEADAWFHDAPVFAEGERALWGALARACPETPRMAPLAHVTWEILLDGALVRREGEALLGELRRDLAALPADELERSAEAHHFSLVERTPGERATFEARLARVLSEIARGPWILGYAEAEGVAVSVSGIRARLGLPPIRPGELPALLDVLAAFAERADAALGAVLDRAG